MNTYMNIGAIDQEVFDSSEQVYNSPDYESIDEWWISEDETGFGVDTPLNTSKSRFAPITKLSNKALEKVTSFVLKKKGSKTSSKKKDKKRAKLTASDIKRVFDDDQDYLTPISPFQIEARNRSHQKDFIQSDKGEIEDNLIIQSGQTKLEPAQLLYLTGVVENLKISENSWGSDLSKLASFLDIGGQKKVAELNINQEDYSLIDMSDPTEEITDKTVKEGLQIQGGAPEVLKEGNQSGPSPTQENKTSVDRLLELGFNSDKNQEKKPQAEVTFQNEVNDDQNPPESDQGGIFGAKAVSEVFGLQPVKEAKKQTKGFAHRFHYNPSRQDKREASTSRAPKTFYKTGFGYAHSTTDIHKTQKDKDGAGRSSQLTLEGYPTKSEVEKMLQSHKDYIDLIKASYDKEIKSLKSKINNLERVIDDLTKETVERDALGSSNKRKEKKGKSKEKLVPIEDSTSEEENYEPKKSSSSTKMPFLDFGCPASVGKLPKTGQTLKKEKKGKKTISSKDLYHEYTASSFLASLATPILSHSSSPEPDKKTFGRVENDEKGISSQDSDDDSDGSDEEASKMEVQIISNPNQLRGHPNVQEILSVLTGYFVEKQVHCENVSKKDLAGAFLANEAELKSLGVFFSIPTDKEYKEFSRVFRKLAKKA